MPWKAQFNMLSENQWRSNQEMQSTYDMLSKHIMIQRNWERPKTMKMSYLAHSSYS